MSSRLMIFLLVVYAAILVASIVERRWYRALYWLGAILIMTSVLGMGIGKK